MRGRRWAWIPVIAIVACASIAPTAKAIAFELEPARVDLAAPIVFGPVEHPARSFGEVGPTATSPELDALYVEFVLAVGDRGQVTRDPRLDIAAAELSRVVASGGALGDGVVTFALREHGVVEPAARAVVMTSTLSKDLVEALEYDNARIGIGGNPTVVIVTHSMLASMAPIPRRVELLSGVNVSGVVAASLHAPHITITTDRIVQRIPVTSPDGRTFSARFECGNREDIRWVSIEACDVDNHPAPIALIPVACGSALPTTYRIEPIRSLVTDHPADWLAALINHERVGLGMSPLRLDLRAKRVASEYATAMMRAKRVAHRLDGTSAADRMRAAGAAPPTVLETTFHAADLARASELLLNDISFHAAFARDDLTHLGIGVAEDRDHGLYVTIIYTTIVPPVDMASVTREVEAKIRSIATDSAGIRIDPELSTLAKKMATSLAGGARQQEIWPEIGNTIRVTAHAKLFDSAVFVAQPPQPISEGLLATSIPFNVVGFGIAQSPRGGPFAGQVWVVVFYVSR